MSDLGAHPSRRDEEHDGVDEELGVHHHVADENGELGQEPSPVDIQLSLSVKYGRKSGPRLREFSGQVESGVVRNSPPREYLRPMTSMVGT